MDSSRKVKHMVPFVRVRVIGGAWAVDQFGPTLVIGARTPGGAALIGAIARP
ncbi:MAG TPA: hypothetical protein VND67_02315 [Acidimicrobiales bacterium]|nr:hypothetical protein [Acidimicrobiales bacterium]